MKQNVRNIFSVLFNTAKTKKCHVKGDNTDKLEYTPFNVDFHKHTTLTSFQASIENFY